MESRLPARSAHPRRPQRQQRLAAGTAEAAVEGHLGQRRVHQRAHGRAAEHPDRRVRATQDQPVIEIRLSGPHRAACPSGCCPARPTMSSWCTSGTAATRRVASARASGHDVFGLRTSQRAVVRRRRRRHEDRRRRISIASTQNHFAMEGRNPVRVVDVEEFTKNPKAVEQLGPRSAAARRCRSIPGEHAVQRRTSGAWRSI